MSTWTQEDQAWYEHMQRLHQRDEENAVLLKEADSHHMKAWEVARAAGWHPNEDMLNNSYWQMKFPLVVTKEQKDAWDVFHQEMVKYHELESQTSGGDEYRLQRIEYHTKMLSWPSWEA